MIGTSGWVCTIAYHKANQSGSSSDSEASLQDRLNAFYARFNWENIEVLFWASIASGGCNVSRRRGKC